MSKCGEMIVSEDIYDYIVAAVPGRFEQILENPSICAERVDSRWLIAHTVLPADRQLNVSSLSYYTIPKLFGLMDTTSFDDSGITSILNQPYLNTSGQGVIVGFVDTGIDYLHTDFRNSSGKTRIGVIWDQTDLEGEGSGGGSNFPYGRIYTEEQINAAININDRGGNPYEVVNERDELGHGTFIAGVACASRGRDYTGAAPESEIAVVKLKGAKKYLKDFYFVRDDVAVFQETDIMLAVRFLQVYAAFKGLPLVVCLGLGSAQGSRVGTTPLDDYLDSVTKVENTVVVTAMGNEANARTHYSGIAEYENNTPALIEINVENNSKGFILEIWAGSLDVLSVSIISPTGEMIDRIPARAGENRRFRFLLENSEITVDYQLSETVSGYENIFIRFVTPSEGIWRVNVYSLTNLRGIFNAWLSLKQFMTSEVFFLEPNPDITLTEPAAASRVISVGAYNHYTQGMYIDSGRGYTPDERVKPDIVAPGVNVYGTRAGGDYTTKSGTSVAAAHVAGAAALFLSWGVTQRNALRIGNSEIKSLLIRGARRDAGQNFPNRQQGYGKLDVLQSFNQLRIY